MNRHKRCSCVFDIMFHDVSVKPGALEIFALIARCTHFPQVLIENFLLVLSAFCLRCIMSLGPICNRLNYFLPNDAFLCIRQLDALCNEMLSFFLRSNTISFHNWIGHFRVVHQGSQALWGTFQQLLTTLPGCLFRFLGGLLWLCVDCEEFLIGFIGNFAVGKGKNNMFQEILFNNGCQFNIPDALFKSLIFQKVIHIFVLDFTPRAFGLLRKTFLSDLRHRSSSIIFEFQLQFCFSKFCRFQPRFHQMINMGEIKHNLQLSMAAIVHVVVNMKHVRMKYGGEVV